MEFLKKFFKDDDRIIGLCGLKKITQSEVFVPKFDVTKTIYTPNYKNNFFLL